MPYKFEELTDIKLIILKTVQYFKTAMPEAILTDAILDRGFANFFDLQQAVYELTENRLLTYYEEKGARLYSLTRLGETAAEGYQSRIPRSVLEKLYQTVRIKIREYENGLSLIADYEMAQNVCRRFKCDPQVLYSEVLSALIPEHDEN